MIKVFNNSLCLRFRSTSGAASICHSVPFLFPRSPVIYLQFCVALRLLVSQRCELSEHKLRILNSISRCLNTCSPVGLTLTRPSVRFGFVPPTHEPLLHTHKQHRQRTSKTANICHVLIGYYSCSMREGFCLLFGKVGRTESCRFLIFSWRKLKIQNELSLRFNSHENLVDRVEAQAQPAPHFT